jgi:indolepyruvate decarboxylase
VLLLGTFMTDINLGIYTAKLDLPKCIYVTSEQLQISHHFYHGIPLHDFLDGLIKSNPTPAVREIPDYLRESSEPEFAMQPESELRVSRMMNVINDLLDDRTIVIADIGDALFAATELVIHERTDFLSPAYYTSMGFAVPAALGACVASPSERVLAICGDGAFQMTGNELSTLVKHSFSPIIIVLDNHGYGTERFLQEGEWKYNEINPWNYYKLPSVYGGGKGYLVKTEGEFNQALREAWKDRSQMHIIQAKLAEGDASKTLLRLAERLGARVKSGA